MYTGSSPCRQQTKDVDRSLCELNQCMAAQTAAVATKAGEALAGMHAVGSSCLDRPAQVLKGD